MSRCIILIVASLCVVNAVRTDIHQLAMEIHGAEAHAKIGSLANAQTEGEVDTRNIAEKAEEAVAALATDLLALLAGIQSESGTPATELVARYSALSKAKDLAGMLALVSDGIVIKIHGASSCTTHTGKEAVTPLLKKGFDQKEKSGSRVMLDSGAGTVTIKMKLSYVFWIDVKAVMTVVDGKIAQIEMGRASADFGSC